MASRSLLSDMNFNKLQVNKLQVNKLQVNKLQVNKLKQDEEDDNKEDASALIHYTIIGQNSKVVKYLKEEDNLIYYELDFTFDEISHIAPAVINSKHGNFYDIFDTKQLFTKIINGFKIHGRNFNIDSIENENLPSTVDNKSNDGSRYNMTFIFINENYEKIMLPCTIYHIDFVDNSVKMVFYVNDDGIIKNNQTKHDSYNSRDPHYHTFPAYKISNTNGSSQYKINIPRQNFMMFSWTVNIYLWFPGMFAIIGAAVAVATEAASAAAGATIAAAAIAAEAAAVAGGVLVSAVAEVAVTAATVATDAMATALVAGGEALESAIPGIISEAVTTAAAQAGGAVGAIVSATVDAVAGPIVGTMIDTIVEVGVEGAINLAAEGLSTAIENIAEDGIIDFVEGMTDQIGRRVAQDAVEAAIKKAITKSIEKVGTDYLKNLIKKEAEDVDPTLGSLVSILNTGTSTNLNDWIVRGTDIRDIVTASQNQLKKTTASIILNPPVIPGGQLEFVVHTYNKASPTLTDVSQNRMIQKLITPARAQTFNFEKIAAIEDDPYLWTIFWVQGSSKYYLKYTESDKKVDWWTLKKDELSGPLGNILWKVVRTSLLGYSIQNVGTKQFLYFSKNELNVCNKAQLTTDNYQEFFIYTYRNQAAFLQHFDLHYGNDVYAF